LERPRDITWSEFVAGATGEPSSHEAVEANEPAFILATSGTTARPKLVVHTHGGYQVHIHCMGRWVFALSADDIWWSTSNIGWIVGHSYMVYAPLLAGSTTIIYEGALEEGTAGRARRRRPGDLRAVTPEDPEQQDHATSSQGGCARRRPGGHQTIEDEGSVEESRKAQAELTVAVG
jgi:acyl-CoA synthetase (AMP-forming)/AMP-acid ligase II